MFAGATSTIVCGHTVGEHATIAAGLVVTKDVASYAQMAGVPAKQIGWICDCGQVLSDELKCSDCGKQYKFNGDTIEEE